MSCHFLYVLLYCVQVFVVLRCFVSRCIVLCGVVFCRSMSCRIALCSSCPVSLSYNACCAVIAVMLSCM